ncbi:MAG TPA: hypothetical protein VMR16_02720, partial [Candidatus Saccharimonadales bacterium]|nr:hypothetical protein [Candidatus Saccharimonadales bacterium]
LTANLALQLFCKKIGIAYLGEACLVDWDGRGRSRSRNYESLNYLLRMHELHFGMDPINLGWKPPYWSDSSWVESIDQDAPPMKVMFSWKFKEKFGAARNIGTLVRMADKTPTTLKVLQGAFGQQHFLTTRAGMLIPSWWRTTKPQPVERAEKRQQSTRGTKEDRPVAFCSRSCCREAIRSVLQNWEVIPFSDTEQFAAILDGLSGLIQRVGIDRVVRALQSAAETIPRADTTEGILGRGDRDITNMAISEATVACIRSNGIGTVCDLLRKKPEELSALPGFEDGMLKEIVHAFALHRLILGTDIHMHWF